jgi:hypothetical protein
MAHAPSYRPGSVRISLFDLVKEGIFDVMPRTKRKPVTPVSTRPNTQRTRNDLPISWVNIRLDESDLAALEGTSNDANIVGGLLLAVAIRGHNFSVKRMDDEVSYCCTITGAASDGSGIQLGVSAFADNPTDAALGCVYKFEEKMGGEFDSSLSTAPIPRTRFR